MKDETISAFAFKTGREIESLINNQITNLENKNIILEAKILQWYFQTKDKEFAKHIGITESSDGIIKYK